MGNQTLSNNDFRLLLAKSKPTAAAFESEKASLQSQAPATEADTMYRDRAAERRLGRAAPPIDLELSSSDFVKGLDYTLLDKVRKGQLEASATGPKSAESQHTDMPKFEVQYSKEGPVTFHSKTSRAIFTFCFNQHQQYETNKNISDLFLPRRMSFVYDMADPYGTNIPVTLRRSKEDCPKPKELVVPTIESNLLKEVSKIMACVAVSKDGCLKKKVRKGHGENQTQEVHKAPPEIELEDIGQDNHDDDDDIFGDAGTDYVPERRNTGARKECFEKRHDDGDVGPPPPEKGTAFVASYLDDEKEYEKETERVQAKGMLKEKQFEMEQTEDAYAECYPSYYYDAGTLYDSDEDGGKALPVAGEEHAHHQQPGENKSKGRKEVIKQAQKEKQKADSELEKIKSIFAEKGYKQGAAFEEKGGQESQSSEQPKLTKRRRI